MAPRKKVTLKKPVIRPSSQAAEKKPIISLGTLVTIVVFAALVLLGVYLSKQAEKEEAAATPMYEMPEYLSVGNGATLTGIEIMPGAEGEGAPVKLTRDEQNVWALELPEAVAADQGFAESAASQLSALEILDTYAGGDPATYGFNDPQYVITLTFGDKTYVLEVGDTSPVNTGYYVRVDQGDIHLVDLSGIDALIQLAKTPPYLATPTPSVTPTLPATETPIPTETSLPTEIPPEATQVGSPTPTPTP